ncbi:MAG: IPT/TIG domain-containing protein, partial [Candidatus Nomurabacteria bacterium]|nr:IPT/TIG domain-containing protein [Candidatus Nomurabacteria bacterium]
DSSTGTIGGSVPFGGWTLYSLRIYNRVLTSAEIAQNAAVDQKRFISPPTVKIGDVDCPNVVVSSATSMSCSIPAESPGTYPITISYNGASETVGQYTYWGVDSYTPTSGDPAGGETLTLTGDGFPYGDASGYVGGGTGNNSAANEGLVAWYDGINNTGGGDAAHDNNSLTWKNLGAAGNTIALNQIGGTLCSIPLTSATEEGGKWDGNGYQFSGGERFCSLYDPTNDLGLVTGTAARTIEMVYKTPTTLPTDFGTTGDYGLGGYGSSDNKGAFYMMYADRRFLIVNARNYGSQISLDLYKNLLNTDTINTATASYDGSSLSSSLFYVNGQSASPTIYDNVGDSAGLNTGTSGIFEIGQRSSDASGFTGEIMSMRIYNRQLTAAEIAQNAKVDEMRYTAVPTVTIGGEACTNLAVESTTKMTCTLPAGTAGATEPIKLSAYDQPAETVGQFTYGTPASDCGYLVYGNAGGYTCDITTNSSDAKLIIDSSGQYSIRDDTSSGIGSAHSIVVIGSGVNATLSVVGPTTATGHDNDAQTPAVAGDTYTSGGLTVEKGTELTLNLQSTLTMTTTSVINDQGQGSPVIYVTASNMTVTGSSNLSVSGADDTGLITVYGGGTFDIAPDYTGIMTVSSNHTALGLTDSGSTFKQEGGTFILSTYIGANTGTNVEFLGGTALVVGDPYAGYIDYDLSTPANLIISNCNCYLEGITMDTPTNLDGTPVYPVFVPTANIGGATSGTITVPASGSGSALSSSYTAPLADLNSLNDNAPSGVSAIVWLPGDSSDNNYKHYTDIATSNTPAGVNPATNLIANSADSFMEYADATAANTNIAQPTWLNFYASTDSISLTTNPDSSPVAAPSDITVASNNGFYNLQFSTNSTSLTDTTAADVCQNRTFPALTADGDLDVNHWAIQPSDNPDSSAPTAGDWLAPADTLNLESGLPFDVGGRITRLWFGSAADSKQPACSYSGSATITATASN